MKKFNYILLTFLVAFGFSSCQDYLTVMPENNQSTNEYWKTKEDVEAVLGAGYYRLRDAQKNLMYWAEARGNGILYTGTITSDGLEEAALKLRQFDILPTNALAKWDKLYKVIGLANSVIKYAPTVKDASFNVNVMNSYLSEAYFQRALAYFYLVRLWKDVPYVSAPYVDDSESYAIAKSSGDEILRSCLADLNNALPAAKVKFPETSYDNPYNSKGRATRWAIYALIADINMWLGNYDEAIVACEAVKKSGQVGLIAGSLWYTNFYPGNSNESIFEIQYSYAQSETNSFISWFYTTPFFKISLYTQNLFELEPLDKRGLYNSYLNNLTSTVTDNLKIWKYCGIQTYDVVKGTANNRSSSQNDQNWILYRLADIYLLEAEAYAMKGDDASLQTSTSLVNTVRARAGLGALPGTNVKLDLIRNILYERQREFLCEGKNWFDLVRIGRRSDPGFKEFFIEQVLQMASASSTPIIRAILQDENAWYLPIHADELTTNKLLIQNPYYEALGN